MSPQRVSEKLRFSLFKSAHFLSLLLPFTLYLCRCLLAKALTLFAMDDIFSQDPEDDLLDLDPCLRHRPRPRLSLYDDADSREDVDRLYFVPYRWWNEAHDNVFGDAVEESCVIYVASSETLSGHSNSDIVLSLRREVDNNEGDNVEEGSSGGEYALVAEGMWLRVLKWYNDSKVALMNFGNHLAAEADVKGVFPLKIRLSFLKETNSLVVKISQKDNAIEFYEKAHNIFGIQAGLRIWDFSGQTALFFSNERIKLSNHCPGKPDSEILLELQVYGSSDSLKVREGMKEEMALEQSKRAGSYCSVSQTINGSTGDVNSLMSGSSTFHGSHDSPPFHSGYRDSFCLGLTGLQNLGNTCFMNSAIQCLAHTTKLVDYFFGDYRKDINYENPLGMRGELALAFGDLLRKLWVPGAAPVAPRMFKLKLASFAPQFSGFNQHDSQEFLAFLLDGLHEDLNRVKSKPYTEARDADDCPDEEIADEYWQNHLARNDSVIVDVCQGQYRSTLVCPVCKKLSVTFDPFMYLSLPLPSTTMRTMTVTISSSDGSALPSLATVTVPKFGSCKDLIQALRNVCSFRSDENLLVAEIYNNRILRLLEEPTDLLSLIRDDDQLVAYRLPKDSEAPHLVVFMHAQVEKNSLYGRTKLCRKIFGIPLVARMSNISKGSYIRKQFLKLLVPFLMPNEDNLTDYDDAGDSGNEDAEMEDATSPAVSDVDSESDSETGGSSHLDSDFQFYLTDEKAYIQGARIKMNEPVVVSGFSRMLNVCVCWPDKMIERYDTRLLSSLPEIFNPGLFTKRPQETVPLYKCLEAFLKEEPLGPEDMWYCPMCKQHQQASKKLDLWRLPEILIIHLKRFSYSHFYKNKMETFIDFPIDDLDLSTYIAHKSGQLSDHYSLYAIINHYGGMGGGHYTAFVCDGLGQWHEFDDSAVSPVGEDIIKTSAAYVLFYTRVPDA
ncbi:ubiquitin carboxyl-terminal hydrolase 8-like [Malania oleifera]|uniref:ubiquitin carboxyl-terminal hydrolase 8-like n=1 Tax=Malania oleifera TaxID=397392 RepID=UPI0025AE74E4|nr:ubiquitin carboxyl-terminal hydrolase 8-like [Malania oleifera]